VQSDFVRLLGSFAKGKATVFIEIFILVKFHVFLVMACVWQNFGFFLTACVWQNSKPLTVNWFFSRDFLFN